MQRPHVFIKEKISLNIVRLKKGGDTFEIVLKNPDKALLYRHDKEKVDIKDVLETEKIFSDAKKGELASEADMYNIFGTDDPLKIADVILIKGEMHLTAEQRKKQFEQKKKSIIEYIHMNAADPKTKLPLPVSRIELALDEAKIQIDPYTPVSAQIDKIIEQIRPVMAMSLDKIKLEVTIPAKYAGSAYGNVKKRYRLSKEEWLNDGSVRFELEIPAGLKPNFFNLVNSITNGDAAITER